MEKKRRICIVSAGEDKKELQELKKHLKPLEDRIAVWDASQVLAGTNRKQAIKSHLEAASIILLLISADFLAADETFRMLKQAVARNEPPQISVVPILLHNVYWEIADLKDLEPLPANKKPISSWPHRNSAYLDVVKGIERIIDNQPEPPPVEDLAEVAWYAPGLSLPAEVQTDAPREQESAATQAEREKDTRPTEIDFLYTPTRNGNEGVASFVLRGRPYSLKYMRKDMLSHQIFLLTYKHVELVRLVIPFATLKPLEKRVAFQLAGVDCLFTFKMSAVVSIMSVKLEVGGLEIFRR